MILHINTAKTWRGGEQQLFYLASGLHKKKIPQIIVGQPESELEKKCIEKGLLFLPVKIRFELDIFAAKKIGEIVKQKKVHLIHTHTAKAHTIGLLVKRNFPELKLVVSRRVDFHIGHNWFSKKKYLSDLNDLFVCVSKKIKEVLLQDGLSNEKVVTIHSGVDLSRFKKRNNPKELKKEFHLNKDTVTIGNIAALVDHKDQATLLKAISKIQTDVPFQFFIVGEGELMQGLIKLTKNLQIEKKVIFTGFRTEVLEFLSLFDIFTLTSKEEGLGTSILDAMASSLPVVATLGGGIGEMLIPERGALVATVGDFQTLAKHYKALIEDKEKRKKFGQFNKKYVKKFSIEETIKKTIQVYYSLISKNLYEK
ncbi:MAG: glycosyltransferase family 4 protein [Leptospiraceae bacterium]|nr:glycosyltransferase family 4 protein [Leptospiraceae bacterium]MCK6381064.1 glycosyltransferase family 4 protein [Leptospiraceae bacterium]NUM40597.1 glycosyltransferase family 4 protein [Leptospiraceae bacterium]